MKNKYNMTIDENIFVAKRNIIDYIWKDANLEGIAITYPDTEAIYNGLSVSGYKVNDILVVNNLKRAWHFVLEHLDFEMDFAYVSMLNKVVGGDDLVNRAGLLRTIPVTIGGTKWAPDFPNLEEINSNLSRLSTLENPTLRAIETMLFLMRYQGFLDGNKRTAMLAANQILISNGAGVLVVPLEKQREFTHLLVEFYETNDNTFIKRFLYDYCIDGMNFDKPLEKNRLEQEPPLPLTPIKNKGLTL